MPHSFYWFTAVLKEDERGLLARDGRIERLLGPGKFQAFDPGRRYSVEVFKVARAEMPAERAQMLARSHPAIAEQNLEIVQAGANEVVIVSLDGDPRHVVSPNTTRAFWTSVTEVGVERINTADELVVAKRHLDKLDVPRSQFIAHAVVEPHETALLIVDGRIAERLAPGRHAFWQVARTVRIAKIDLRPRLVEVTAQEILTKDRIAIRVTLAAFYKVIDPERSVMAVGDLEPTIYRLVQFAIREAVATRTLDEILAARDTLDREVRAFIASRVDALGVEVTDIGVKDIILPGDVRELINKVIEAERTAKANLIRRQEETAATRSLLNTSRLMEDNPLLLRLKELETLEKLVEKVGRIDLHAGGSGGLDALLNKLYRLGGEAAPRAGEDGRGGRSD